MTRSHSPTFVDLHPAADRFLDDVLAGLASTPKALSPKYFYDARGSDLFEAICELPEYYPTRTELALMREQKNVATATGDQPNPPGSGPSTEIKTRTSACR